MIQAPDRVRVSITSGLHRPTKFDQIDEKSVKQVLQEANETRRRSIELSQRLKQFLAPMSIQNLSGETPTKRVSRPHSRLLTVQEDDVIEVINDIQDDNNQNVMDVRVPRLEAVIKTENTGTRSEFSTDSSASNAQQIGREYKILKQLLKDTEESNRRSKELVVMMEKTLATNERHLVKPHKMINKVKRVSDASKSNKVKEDKVRESKRTSMTSTKNYTSLLKKTRPKTTTNEMMASSKTKRPSKVKNSSSAVLIPPPRPKAKRVSKSRTLSSDKPRESAQDESGRKSNEPIVTGKPTSYDTPAIKDMAEMINAIGRRGTDNDEIRSYLTRVSKATA